MASRAAVSVLIVEDEGIIARNLQETLSGLGYDPFGIASTSVQALALASERCPDVVLIDIRIKGEPDGIATAQLLKDRFDLPLIYLTAHADGATLERAKKTEPYAYLVKPVKPQELHSAIEIALYKHAMDRRLRERERWFSTTVRSIGDAVITVDLSGKITFMNAVAEALLGLTLEETQGKLARDVLRVRGHGLQAGEGPLEQALREKRVVQFPGMVLEGAGGAGLAIADSAAPVIDDGQLLGAVMVFHDVSEQQRLQKQLEVADRLASLGTMAAGVAHEINNPLSVVIANAEFVLEQLSASPPTSPASPQAALDAQAELLSAASRIARIVADLQAFSRPEASRSRAVDVRTPIEWAIRSTVHEFRHRSRLSTTLDRVPRVDADEIKLGQIFVNLLLNAAQAIPPGNVDANEVSIVTRTAQDGAVVVEVSDTGEGIAPEALSHIFEPFFTTKPLGVGTGLGLSICHGLVAAMGGKLDVESRPGRGTIFRLTLPAGVEAALPSSLPPRVLTTLRGRLLIVDDEDMVLRALARVLSEHQIVSKDQAREALALIESGERFDVIFCDLMMPNMTGMDFYEALLRQKPELASRVVFLTGAVMTSKVASFLDAVPNRRLHKPFDVDNLRALVQELLSALAGGTESRPTSD